ncbi:uncharacterized protein LOC127751773 [Frankliniella occidentalis]|uniref:Uncharacterized protein LOC127751773 n=1 Tax=Frankliniella occidentalis TaxID=133901 RepID=A0A9C6X9K5_FRAOC|nr:uncharacterized protein LOC127751773 [Frankliniella occidentalis]
MDCLVQKKRPKDGWKIFRKVRIFTFCKTLASAKSLADKAAFTSDVNDDDVGPSDGKRSRKQTSFYSQDQHFGDDDERPLKMLKLNGGNNVNLFGPGSPSTHSDCSKSPASSPLSTSTALSPPSSPADELEVRSKGVTPSASKGVTPSAASNLQVNTGTTPHQVASATREAKTPAGNPPVNSRFLTHFVEMRNEVQELKKMILKIYIVTCGPQEGSSDIQSVPNVPIKDFTDYSKFSTLCSKEDGKLGMVKYLTEAGLNELRETVFAMLKKLMSNEFAMNFNLTGVNRKQTISKKKFDGTAPFIVLKAAVKLHSNALKARGADSRHTYNSAEFRGAVSDWLKDAKKRSENEMARKRKRLQQQQATSDDEQV